MEPMEYGQPVETKKHREHSNEFNIFLNKHKTASLEITLPSTVFAERKKKTV